MTTHRHLGGLNPPQKEAVEYLDGPLLVLAGAGSGKTRVITHRIAQIIAAKAAKPSEILAVTFTNKAAKEMKERVIRLLGSQAQWVWLSTFHSLCARILRENAPLLGFRKTFSIYDESDSLSVIKKIYKEEKIPDSQPVIGVARSRISNAKDNLIPPQNYEAQASDFIEKNVAVIYNAYQKKLTESQAMDFDDLLMKTVELFEKYPDVLAIYQKRFKYILVDEYQDTNHAQYHLTNLLAKQHRNLCVVGDDDQSIYTWRGADITNILDFEKDYPGCKIIKLEQNYRSTQTILDAAHKIISQNTDRKPKKLFTKRTGGDKITLMLCGDEVDEAQTIADKIGLETTKGRSAFDFAVLYRTNSQSRVLEDSLRRKGLPYIIVGGIRFYERAEIKDLIAYLRLLVNPDDNAAFLRIVNTPKRGIGKTGLDKLTSYARAKQMSIFSALVSSPIEIDLKGKAKAELLNLVSILRELSLEIDKMPPAQIAAELIEKIGYLFMLEQERTLEADIRADNVRELVAGIEEYSDRAESPSLSGFLEEASLLTDIDTWDAQSQAVTLMTLHSAKGLEFDTVFIAGMEDGLFPLARNFDDKFDPQEERRLCYVGITRAKSKLYLSMAGFRRRWGNYSGGPSSFLREIPEDLLEIERHNYWSDIYVPRNLAAKNILEKSTSEKPIPNYEHDGLFSVGTFVLHDKFGQGKILKLEGSGENLTLTIGFQQAGIKKIMVKYASLEIISR